MNFLFTTVNKLKRLFIISVVSLSVMSCGSETIATAGISGTGIVFGVITGFGSIFVNGVEYETDSASFNVDGNLTATQDQLKVGMVVKLNTTSFTDGTFEANSVVYDDSIEGPITSTITTISADKKEFTVMGVVVQVDASTTSFDDSSSATPAFDFDSIAQNDVIEVSGFVDANNKVLATLVEKRSVLVSGSTDTLVEMRGSVTSLVPDTSFILNGITINFSAATPLDDLPNGLSEGLVVEVKGLYDSNNNSIQANEIEGEDDDGIGSGSDPNQSVSVQGFISGFTAVDQEFTVSGVRVLLNPNAAPQSILDQLAEGLNVEVEGLIANGVLEADQIEIREGQAEYRAIVQSRDLAAQTLNIGYLNVSGELVMQLDAQSTIVDEDDNPITLNDIVPSDDVKINARVLENGDHLVVRIRRERGENKSYEITGEVEAIVPDVSITIEGLLFQLDPIVDYTAIGGAGSVTVGVEVELEDNDRNGAIDEVSPPT